MTTAKALAKQLKNIGPSMAAKMLEAGIKSPESLRQLGAKKAFSLMYATGDSYGDYNAMYLIALEAAIEDCSIAELSEDKKEAFKQYARKLQAGEQ